MKFRICNVESSVAEKFKTFISRGVLNSRTEEYYELYNVLIYK